MVIFSDGWNTTSPFTVTVGTVTSPVTKLLNVHSKLWCAIQGCIKVLNTTTLQVNMKSLDVLNLEEVLVKKLIYATTHANIDYFLIFIYSNNRTSWIIFYSTTVYLRVGCSTLVQQKCLLGILCYLRFLNNLFLKKKQTLKNINFPKVYIVFVINLIEMIVSYMYYFLRFRWIVKSKYLTIQSQLQTWQY